MTYDEISQSIYTFRQIVTPDTISPDGLGNILDQILRWANARLQGIDELIADCADAQDVDTRLNALQDDLQKAADAIAGLRRDLAECADARTTAAALQDHDTRIKVLLQGLTEAENAISSNADAIAGLRRDLAECADARTTAAALQDHYDRLNSLLQRVTTLEGRITDTGQITVESMTQQDIETIIQNPTADKDHA